MTEEHLIPSIEHLAEVLGQCQEEIIGEWKARAEDLLRDLELDNSTITDHLPDVVAEITRDLALGRHGALSAEHTRGSPPVHGVQRVYDGLDVGQVVAEYNLLRGAFYTVAEAHGLSLAGEGAWIVNHRIDEAVRMAVQAFVAQQTIIRKRQQDEHLAFIAHDLRTPLNAVSLIVDELRKLDDQSQDDAEELFEMLKRNLLRVEDMVSAILEDNAQPESEGTSFQPECRNFELWPLVQRLIQDLRVVATKHEVVVVNDIPRGQSVFADAGLVSQVFQNLLCNAFKYAAKGRVMIGASEEEGVVTCVVQDNGAGIPQDMLTKVFDRLATDPDSNGTGLGLAIVKQIVEAHGGQVRVESNPSAGTTLSFTLSAQG